MQPTVSLGSTSGLSDLHLSDQGIWSIQKGACAIGIVLLAVSRGRVVAIRKAAVSGYEFSNLLALPGGVVRGTANQQFDDCVGQTLWARARDEAGLSPADLHDVAAIHGFAPVTRYTVKGVERFSIVFGVRAALASTVNLVATRRSVSETFLASRPLAWASYAPANRLLIAHALSDEVPESEKSASHGAISEALSFCNAAAATIGLPAVPDPWEASSCA